MNLSGIELFEQARGDSGRGASDTRTGQKVIREMIDTSTQAVEEMQRNIISNKTKAARNVKGTVLIVPAESSALITLRVVVDRTYSAINPEEGYNYQIMAKEVARAIETELNFRNWIIQSRAAAEAYAQEKGLPKVPKSQAERLLEEEGLNRMSVWRWKRTFDDLSAYSWDTLERHYCGDALLTAVIEALPEYFEKHMVNTRTKTVRHVRMTTEFREKFNGMEARVAQMQVVKKPMIARPKPWTVTE